MCGIVGYLGPQASAPILLDGLRRLEYRGYDSAGLAVISGGKIETVRAVGKLRNLEAALQERELPGTTGIGHTRWATHGAPTEVNAHPHTVGDIAVVHNGIIENHIEIRKRLIKAGAKIQSDTDTELVAHLIHLRCSKGTELFVAVRETLEELQGAYAIAVISLKQPNEIVVAKNSSPLVLGVGDGEAFCASDIPAILPYTRQMIFLEDGDCAQLSLEGAKIVDKDGREAKRKTQRIDWSPTMAEKAGYKHFMLKEIFEQPRAIEDTLRGRLEREAGTVNGLEIGLSDSDAQEIKRIIFIACGTSHYASMVGRHFVESLARIPATCELASEFRNREPVVGPGDLVVAVSQSGETLDTLTAAQKAKEKGAKVLSIVNVIGSAIARMADAAFYTHAGPEISVASTKCFSAQMANFLMLAIWLGEKRDALSGDETRQLVEDLARIPQQMDSTLASVRQVCANLAKRYRDARDVLFLGRGYNYPIALEGALKLKEISYVHAEGYAAGEMKHGPIALIDATVPVFVLATKDSSYERTLSNLQEAKAREAMVIGIATEGDEDAREQSDDLIEVPAVREELVPFLSVLPLQMYAYYVADFKGTDVDQPRNLAKTVTVE